MNMLFELQHYSQRCCYKKAIEKKNEGVCLCACVCVRACARCSTARQKLKTTCGRGCDVDAVHTSQRASPITSQHRRTPPRLV